MGIFLDAAVREYACSGLYSLLALVLGRPNHYLRHMYAFICVRVVCVCVFEYASTKYRIYEGIVVKSQDSYCERN